MSRIETACSNIHDLGPFDCIIGETASCAPVLFQLRRFGYSGPLVLIPHVNPYPLRMFLHVLLAKQAWGPADRVIVGSSTAASLYQRFFGMRACVVPTYGIDTTLFTKRDRQASRKELGLFDSPLILYTGRLAPDKNIGVLLGVYQSLRRAIPELRLVLCTRFAEERYLRALASNLSDAVLLQDFRLEEMPTVYNAADLFVSCATSYYETFGRSPLEAVACGIPVVVPAWNGFRDYIHSDAGTLVPVDFFEEPISDAWSYGIVDLSKFVTACVEELKAPRLHIPAIDPELSTLAACRRMRESIHAVLGTCSVTPVRSAQLAVADGLVRRIVEALGIKSSDALLSLATASYCDLPPINTNLQRELYFALFNDPKPAD
jgi:glycosyltransferase involved in cell wall biosynthesis